MIGKLGPCRMIGLIAAVFGAGIHFLSHISYYYNCHRAQVSVDRGMFKSLEILFELRHGHYITLVKHNAMDKLTLQKK